MRAVTCEDTFGCEKQAIAREYTCGRDDENGHEPLHVTARGCVCTQVCVAAKRMAKCGCTWPWLDGDHTRAMVARECA